MKKITKILLIILSFFLINIDVYAEEEEEVIENETYTVTQATNENLSIVSGTSWLEL